MMTATDTTDPRPALRDALADIRAKISELRDQRARGIVSADAAKKLRDMREQEEMLADRLMLAEHDAAAAARAAAAEAARQAAAQRRAEIAAIHAEVREADARLHLAAEAFADALAAVVAQSRDLAQREPALAGRWISTRLVLSLEVLSAAWPDGMPMPIAKPIPFRPREVRAQHPDRCAGLLNEFLPVPASDEPQPGSIGVRITLDADAVTVEAA